MHDFILLIYNKNTKTLFYKYTFTIYEKISFRL